jgi:hypothetical protein
MKATILALVVPIALLLLGVGLVMASPIPDYYNYSSTITVENGTGAAMTNLLVPMNINWNALVDQGYLGADGQDILIMSNGSEQLGIAQATTPNDPATWWIPVTSLANGATQTFTLYIGQNTTAADNPQSLSIVNTATATSDFEASVTTAGVTGASVTLDAVNFTAWPASGTVTVFEDLGTGGPKLTVSSAGTLAATGFGGGACNMTRSLSLATDYTITFTGWNNSSDAGTCTLIVNGTSTSDQAGAGTVLTGTHTVTIGGSLGAVFNVARVSFSSRTGAQGVTVTALGTWAFEPTDMAQSQKGVAGNSYTWKSTVQDKTANNFDGTWTQVQDPTDITVTVGPALAIQASTAGSSSEVTPDPFGTSFDNGANLDPFGDSFSAAGSWGWPFNIFTPTLIAQGVPSWLIATFFGIPLSFIFGALGFAWTRTPALTFISAALPAMFIEYAAPIEPVVIVLTALALFAMVILFPRAWERL